MAMLSHMLVIAALFTVAAALHCTQVDNLIIGEDFIQSHSAAGAAECCDQCNANAQCVAYTYNSLEGTCYLKDNLNINSTSSHHISGTNGRAPIWSACTGKHASLPFCDTTKNLEDRINDLVSRVPLDGIGTQLKARESVAMPDIGVPSYYWGTNAIHGLQNTNCLPNGQCPTSFPAPNGLAASFNYSYVEAMGTIIGREMRAYYNAQQHNGLDSWSPTHNPSRDPRWGRNVESPGEDPLVCGLYSTAYTKGIQFGPDPSVLQAVVTLKHWLAYSLESYHGHKRRGFNAIVSAYDLADTYLVPWEYAVRNGGAMGVMCSYNAVNGVPTCGNPNLTAILREDWGFQGYITSDSDSIADIYKFHHYAPDAPTATAYGLKAGCDINSGDTYANNVATAINRRLVTREDADKCLFRSYKMRFLMGLFDPNVPNYYRNISTAEVGMLASQQLSLEAARATMTLLKNDNNTLPFHAGVKVAVVGVSSNSSGDLLGNYVGPICPLGGYDCVPTIFQMVASVGGGQTTLVDDPSRIDDAVQAAKDADVVVLVISNADDGGSEGKDRTSIGLEASQEAFAQAVLKVGKPTTLVMINGGLISIDTLKSTAPAILEAFMPGTHGAQAIAETIFGMNNPGGKLPVTMYPANFVNENDFLNMSMSAFPGRSYKYYTGTPLFPFGFGLSYTNFSLSWSPAPPVISTVTQLNELQNYTCTVTNTGYRAGDEVVFGFFKPQRASLLALPLDNPVPRKQLFGFQRVHLAAGASIEVTLTLNSTALGLVDMEGHRSLHAGSYGIVLTRGHADDISTFIHVELEAPLRISTFRKFW